MKKKVAIIGGSLSRADAPYDDPEYEIWGCNEMEYPGRVDLYFEMHPMVVQNETELEWLKACKLPVYILEETPLVPQGIKYPLEEILKQSWAKEYFCCTMAYQIALAMHQGRETIGLWGFNMDVGSPRERTVESACMQWWLGIATGMGIKVVWEEHPAIRRHKYGYDYFDEMSHIDSWVARLAIHTLYRIGPKHAFCGGDPLRRRVE